MGIQYLETTSLHWDETHVDSIEASVILKGQTETNWSNVVTLAISSDDTHNAGFTAFLSMVASSQNWW